MGKGVSGGQYVGRMPTNPPPPTDLAGLIEAYASTGQAILDIGMMCRPEEFDKPTQCPGWTVKDQISHVVAMENRTAGGVEEEVEVPDYEWVTTDVKRFMENGVEARRKKSGHDVVEEWKRLFPRRMRQLRDPSITAETVVPGPFGPRTVAELLTGRIADLWVHEQDLRQAVNWPGNLDSGGAAIFSTWVLDAFPKNAARGADLPIGTSVIMDVTGPVLAREGVRIVPGEDDRPFGESLFSGAAHVDDVDEATGEIIPLPSGSTVSIRLSTESLTRRGAGRVPTSQLRYSVEGDEEFARRVLDALTITP